MNIPLRTPPPDFPNPFASLNAITHWLSYRFDRLENLMSDQHAQLADVEQKLSDEIVAMAQRVNAKQEALATTITTLTAQVADLQTQLANAVTQQTDLTADIADLETEITAIKAVDQEPAATPDPTADPPPTP